MGILDSVIDAVAADPTLTIIVLTLLGLVFGGYFFLRRILAQSAKAYQQGKREQ